jgi:hypothetical protein
MRKEVAYQAIKQTHRAFPSLTGRMIILTAQQRLGPSFKHKDFMNEAIRYYEDLRIQGNGNSRKILNGVTDYHKNYLLNQKIARALKN